MMEMTEINQQATTNPKSGVYFEVREGEKKQFPFWEESNEQVITCRQRRKQHWRK